MPPSYSAVKVDGKRSYDLARKDKDVELKPKVLVVDEIELLDFRMGTESAPAIPQEKEATEPASNPLPRTGMRNKAFLTSPAQPTDTADYPSMTIRVVCSKGTYIRALARDIGTALGSGAHLTALRRTRVGEVHISTCMTMDTFSQWLEEQDIIQEQNTTEAQKKVNSKQ